MRLPVVTALGCSLAIIAAGEIGFRGPGLYEMMNKRSGRMVALDRNGRSVIQIVSRSQENQRWVLEPAPAGAYYIRSAVNGRVLQITANARSAPVECARFDGGPNQRWFLQPGSDGNPFIVSAAGGRVLDIPNGSSREGLRLQIYDRNGDSNQQFVFNFIREPPDRDRDRRSHWDRDGHDRDRDDHDGDRDRRDGDDRDRR